MMKKKKKNINKRKIRDKGWENSKIIRRSFLFYMYRGEYRERALMFPRQEIPSPSHTFYLLTHSLAYFYSTLSVRLESVPLHFLLQRVSQRFPPTKKTTLRATPQRFRSTPTLFHSPSSSLHPPLWVPSDAMTTTCKHSGICNSNAAKRNAVYRKAVRNDELKRAEEDVKHATHIYIYLYLYIHKHNIYHITLLLLGNRE